MPEIIDAFAHVLPRDFFETLREEHPSDELEAMNDERFWDVDRRLADLNDAGIDKQVLTLARASLLRGLGHDEALPLIREANDAVADYAQGHERFIGVGTVPFLTDEYVDEMVRCVSDLGLAGVQIFSNVEGRPLDHESHETFWAKADATDTVLWLHPQLHEWHDWAEAHMLHKIYGWPFDTTMALARLACTGVLERHDLDIVAHHAGGMIPHLATRFEDMYDGVLQSPDIFPYDVVDLPQHPLEYLKEIHGDANLSGSVHATQCAFDFYGTNMVFATDHPFGPDGGRRWPPVTVDAVDAIDATEAETEAIFAGTLNELIGA